MLQNKTNSKKIQINYENNNFVKSNHKKWLSFYTNKNHYLLQINQTAGDFL